MFRGLGLLRDIQCLALRDMAYGLFPGLRLEGSGLHEHVCRRARAPLMNLPDHGQNR